MYSEYEVIVYSEESIRYDELTMFVGSVAITFLEI